MHIKKPKTLKLSNRQKWYIVGTIVGLVFVFGLLIRALDTFPIDSFNRCADAGNPVSDSNPPTCSEGGRYYVGPISTPEPSNEPMTNLPMKILVDGDSGGNFPRSSQLINNQTAWSEYWRWIHNGKSVTPPIIPVDFSKKSIIAISEGVEQTTGYVYKITNVYQGNTRSVVDIRESIPTVTCKVENKPTNRYFIIEIPKIFEPISYRTSTEKRKCTAL